MCLLSQKNSDIESAIQDMDHLKKEVEKLRLEIASITRVANNEKSLELSIERLKSHIVTLKIENDKIFKSIKIIGNKNNQESVSEPKKSSTEARLNGKDTNVRGFDMARLDKWLIGDDEIESGNENEDKTEELFDYGFHFQMEVIDGINSFCMQQLS